MKNKKLLMMNLLMLLNMLNEIFLHTIISIKWLKQLETLADCFRNDISDRASDTSCIFFYYHLAKGGYVVGRIVFSVCLSVYLWTLLKKL